MKKLIAAAAIMPLTFALAGCILEAPPSRYWIENNTDSVIVMRQTIEGMHLGVKEVPARQKVEVRGQVAGDSCTRGFEIVDQAGRLLRTVGKICDGDTVVYP